MPEGRSERPCCYCLATAEISRIDTSQNGCTAGDIGRLGAALHCVHLLYLKY